MSINNMINYASTNDVGKKLIEGYSIDDDFIIGGAYNTESLSTDTNYLIKNQESTNDSDISQFFPDDDKKDSNKEEKKPGAIQEKAEENPKEAPENKAEEKK